MATGYSKELEGVADGSLNPAALLDGRLQGGRVRGYIATFDMSRAAVKKTNGDKNHCFTLPKGEKPFMLGTSGNVTMGAAATIAIGNAATPGKYRAAAIHTATTGLALSMLPTALDDDPLADDEDVQITIGAADLPGAGIFQVLILTLGR